MNSLNKMFEELDAVYAALPEYGYVGLQRELRQHIERNFKVSSSRSYVVVKDWCFSRNVTLPTERDAYFNMLDYAEQADIEPVKTEQLRDTEEYLFNRSAWYRKHNLSRILV